MRRQPTHQAQGAFDRRKKPGWFLVGSSVKSVRLMSEEELYDSFVRGCFISGVRARFSPLYNGAKFAGDDASSARRIVMFDGDPPSLEPSWIEERDDRCALLSQVSGTDELLVCFWRRRREKCCKDISWPVDSLTELGWFDVRSFKSLLHVGQNHPTMMRASNLRSDIDERIKTRNAGEFCAPVESLRKKLAASLG